MLLRKSRQMSIICVLTVSKGRISHIFLSIECKDVSYMFCGHMVCAEARLAPKPSRLIFYANGPVFQLIRTLFAHFKVTVTVT